jgi:hypothetical protein
MRVLAITGTLITLGQSALAGAWPQETGHAFLSLSYEVAVPRGELAGGSGDPAPEFEGYRTLYFEYGLTPRLTAGLDLGGVETDITSIVNDAAEQMARQQGYDADTLDLLDATDNPTVATWSGIVFLRAAIGNLDSPHRFAAQLGIGQRSYEQKGLYYGLEETRTEAIVRPLLAYGYGFAGKGYTGWAGIDASIEFRERTEGEPVKLDGILGLKPEATPRTAWLLGLQSGDFPGIEPYAKLLPGIAVRVWRTLSLETSAVIGFAGDDTIGARIGLWAEF